LAAQPAIMSVPNLIIAGALVGGGLWLLYISRDLIWHGLSSYWWSRTEGKIVKSKPVAFAVPGTPGDGRSRSWIPALQYCETDYSYVYVVESKAYRSSTYCFGGWMDRAGAEYSRREKVTVYYDPRYPGMSVLKRGIKFSAVFGLIPVMMGILWVILSPH
jgi:hypothetical protein